MAKKLYSFSNLMLTSLIALLGFGSCKTTKKVESPKDPTNNIDKLTIDSIFRPQTPDRTVRLLYGVPPTRKDVKKK